MYVHMCVYVCIYMCIYIYTCVYIHIYIDMYVYIHMVAARNVHHRFCSQEFQTQNNDVGAKAGPNVG